MASGTAGFKVYVMSLGLGLSPSSALLCMVVRRLTKALDLHPIRFKSIGNPENFILKSHSTVTVALKL